jgi:alkylhydroperoxidase family enzyme
VLGHDVTQAVLTDWHSAPINSGLQGTLGFIEKLTLSPDRLESEDVAALRAEGLTDQAIADAVYVCVGFNIVNRVADALGVRVPPPKVFVRGVKFLRIFGYKMLSGLQIGDTGSRDTYRLKMDNAQRGNNAVDDPYGSKVRQLKEAVLSGPGTLDPTVRKAASLAAELPDVLGPYVKKVATHAYTVTDQDIAALHQAGYSDDQIFEVTVSAALGAGLVRLESGLRALALLGVPSHGQAESISSRGPSPQIHTGYETGR